MLVDLSLFIEYAIHEYDSESQNRIVIYSEVSLPLISLLLRSLYSTP